MPVAAGHDHEHMTLPMQPAASGLSLYQLTSLWRDQHGETLKLSDFAGQILVLAMVYTHCDNACPRIIADMRRIRKALGDQSSGVSYLLASIDPDRDTVEHLRAFGESTGLTAQGWRLLRASEGDVRELAAVLGIQYARTSPQDFAHSNVITVIGRNGVIEHQQVGLGVSPTATIQHLQQLLAAKSEGADKMHHHRH